MRTQAAAGAALIGTGVALTDYVDNPVRRGWAYAGLMLTGAGVIAFSTDNEGKRYTFGDDSTLVVEQMRQEIGDLGVTPGPGSDSGNFAERGPVKTWLLLAAFMVAFVALSYFSIRMDLAVMKAIAGFFRKRGASRPYTLTGVLYAALVYAAFEFDRAQK